MRLGFTLPMCGNWATPENQVLIGRQAEELGYASVWTVQRLLYPLKPQNDYPPLEGQAWPGAFRRVLDPIVSLAHVAVLTERVRLGTAALVAPYYTPVVLAKLLATLDQVSGGRLAVGIGLGWSMDEYEAVGVPFERRGARMDEFVEALLAALRHDVVDYAGDFYRIPASYVEPKPVQQPNPPLFIGGYGRPAVERAARLGDGFIGGNLPLEQIASLLSALRAALEDRGRDPRSFTVVSRGTTVLHAGPQGEHRRPLCGSMDEIRADIEAYREVGLDELFIELNYDPRIAADDCDPVWAMDHAAFVMEALAPLAAER